MYLWWRHLNNCYAVFVFKVSCVFDIYICVPRRWPSLQEVGVGTTGMGWQLHPDSLLSESRKFLLNCRTHILQADSETPPWLTELEKQLYSSHLSRVALLRMGTEFYAGNLWRRRNMSRPEDVIIYYYNLLELNMLEGVVLHITWWCNITTWHVVIMTLVWWCNLTAFRRNISSSLVWLWWCNITAFRLNISSSLVWLWWCNKTAFRPNITSSLVWLWWCNITAFRRNITSSLVWCCKMNFDTFGLPYQIKRSNVQEQNTVTFGRNASLWSAMQCRCLPWGQGCAVWRPPQKR